MLQTYERSRGNIWMPQNGGVLLPHQATGAFALSMSTSLASIGLTPDDPTTLPGSEFLWSWHDSSQGLVLGDTPIATGTTPPVLVLSGDLEQNVSLQFTIDLGGPRGTMRFSCTQNGVAIVTNELSSVSNDLGNGIFAEWASGAPTPYNIDNVYRSKLATFNDGSSNDFAFEEATPGKQPIIDETADLNGHYGLLGNGVDTIMTNTGNWGNGLIGGSDQPFLFVITAQFLSLNGADNSCLMGPGSATANNHFLQVGATTSGNNKYRIAKHDGTTLADRSGGTVGTPPPQIIFAYSEDGTTVHYEVDGAAISLSSSAFNVGNMTDIDRGSMWGVWSNGAEIRKAHAYCWNFITYRSGLNAGSRAAILQYCQERYGL